LTPIRKQHRAALYFRPSQEALAADLTPEAPAMLVWLGAGLEPRPDLFDEPEGERTASSAGSTSRGGERRRQYRLAAFSPGSR
jgi:hypothetical protein